MSGEEDDKQENKKKKRLPTANRSLAGSAIDSGNVTQCPKCGEYFYPLASYKNHSCARK
jgi:uncharacterized OB-fold protein